ncbi:MAG: response regulator transcription factor [Nitrospiria bacterium]
MINENQIKDVTGEETVYLLDAFSPAVASLEKELTHFNVQTRLFEDIETGLQEIKKSPPDLLMLDPNQIGTGDFEIIQVLKSLEELKHVPFLISSDMVPRGGVVRSLEFGGDDFLSKPVKIGEAVSRIRGLLRRKKMIDCRQKEDLISVGIIEINMNDCEIKSNGQLTKLTFTEALLLKELAKKPGCVISRQKLLQSVWPADKIIEDQNLDVHISSIRKKIEENPRRPEIILTIRGVGFKLNV